MNSDVIYDNDSMDVSSTASADITIGPISSADLTTFSVNGGYSLPTSSIYTYNTSSPNYGNITINTVGGSGSASSFGGYITSSPSNSLHVTSDAEFDGDIKWKGRSLGDLLNKIESRLAILSPDSKKLEHFAALKKAYDNYKALEALCELPEEENESS
jgi:hypothetical protein